MSEIEALIQTCREFIEDWEKTGSNPKWVISKGLVERANKEFRLTQRTADLVVCTCQFQITHDTLLINPACPYHGLLLESLSGKGCTAK
jgi:hypothetical protein